MTFMMEIKELAPEDTYEIRETVFRKKSKNDTYRYESDHFKGSFHLGAFIDGKLVSVASFLRENNHLFEEIHQYRLQGMATLEEYQGQQIGSKLLAHGEKILKQKHARLLWCHAKFPVSNYYTRFGLREHGEAFVIDKIGPHKVMFKML